MKEEDFRNLQLPGWNPNLAVPVGSAKLTIADILKQTGDGGYLVTDSNGFLTVYHRSTILSEYAREIIQFDTQQKDTTVDLLFPVTLPVGDSMTLSYSFTQNFSNSYDDVVDSIRFRQGTFTIEVESMMDRDAKLILTSPYITKNNVPLRKVIDLDYNGVLPVTATSQIDLDGYTFRFNHVGNKNNLDFWYDIRVYGDNNPNPGPFPVKISVTQSDLEYRALFGLIKTRSMSLLQDVVTIDFFKKGLGGNFYINDPKIGLHFRNSFGIPVSVAVDPLKGMSDVNPPYQVQLTGLPVPFMLNSPTLSQVGQYALTSLELNKNNSNIDAFINLLPQQIEYAVEGIINPTGTVPGNFVLDTSHFEVELELEIPLEGYANGFTLQDTMDFKFEEEELDKIEWIMFRLNAESTFPVDAALQVTFLDSLYNPIDSLFDAARIIVPGAIPGPPPLYKTTSPAKKTIDIKLTSEKIRKLNKNVKYIFLTGTIDTSGGGSQVVRIYTDNYLQMHLGIQTKLIIDPNHI